MSGGAAGRTAITTTCDIHNSTSRSHCPTGAASRLARLVKNNAAAVKSCTMAQQATVSPCPHLHNTNSTNARLFPLFLHRPLSTLPGYPAWSNTAGRPHLVVDLTITHPGVGSLPREHLIHHNAETAPNRARAQRKVLTPCPVLGRKVCSQGVVMLPAVSIRTPCPIMKDISECQSVTRH